MPRRFPFLPRVPKRLLRSRQLVRLERRLPGQQVAVARGGSWLLARAGGKTLGGPLPGGRLTRPLGVLVTGALLFLGAHYFLGQGLGVVPAIEGAARAQYIPLLEKQLGAKIEVGEFSTDWLGRLQVENIVIGRDGRLPTGALLRARRATVSLDLLGLISRRKTPLEALENVTLRQPQVFLERDARGAWNWQKLGAGGARGSSAQWDGRVDVEDGRVYYRDLAIPSRSRMRLEVDATAVSGRLESRAKLPFRLTALVGNAVLVGRNFSVQNVPLAGAFSLKTSVSSALNGSFSTTLGAIPLALCSDYVFPQGQIQARGGTVGGNLRLSIAGGKFTPSGALRVVNGDMELPFQRWPRAGKSGAGETMRFTAINGNALFAGTALELDNLKGRFLDGEWSAVGRVFIPAQQGASPTFDVRLRTAKAPVARLLAIADPRVLPRGLKLQNAALDAQIAGTPRNLSVAGRVNISAARAKMTLRGESVEAGFVGARGLFAAALAPRTPLRYSARISAPLVTVTGRVALGEKKQNVSFRARDALVWLAGAAANAPFEGGLSARSWDSRFSDWGQTRGRNLRLAAATPTLQTPDFRGQIETDGVALGALRRAAFSPDAARFLGEAGVLGARANFGGVGTRAAFFDLDARLSRVALRREGLPQALRAVPASLLELRDLRLQIAWRSGLWRVQNARALSALGAIEGALSGPTLEVKAPLTVLPEREIAAVLRARGLDLAGQWRGRVAITADLQKQGAPLRARFALTADRAILSSRGQPRLRLSAPAVSGDAVWMPGRSWSARGRISARELAAWDGKVGNLGVAIPDFARGLRARAARLAWMVSGDFAGGGPHWSARVSVPTLALVLPAPWTPAISSRFLTLRDTLIVADGRRGVLDVTRARSRWAGATLDASGQLSQSGFGGAVLARDLEARALQTVLAPQTASAATFRGVVNARAEFTPGKATAAIFHMPQGAVLVRGQNSALPIAALRARALLQDGVATLEDLRFWSESAQITAAGRARFNGRDTGAWERKTPESNARVSVRGLRLTRLPLEPKLRVTAGLDGLLSGDFSVQIGETVEVLGRAQLDGATAVGAEIGAAQGELRALRDEAGGWRVALANWKGRVENADFRADLEADTAQNYWRVTLSTPKIAARRIALLQTRTAKRLGRNSSGTLPVEGDFFADIDLNGEFRLRAGETARSFWVPRAGYAILRSPSVRFRGREAGSLDADFSIFGDLARIRKLELNPPGENLRRVPAIKISGVLPISPSDSRLRAQLEVGEAPLEFFRDALREARVGLSALGIRLGALDQAVSYSQTLPDGLQGRVAVKAGVGGSWGDPSVSVSHLTLRDGRVPLPQGGLSAPATLDAAFSFAGGAVSIQQSTFQIAKSAGEKGSDDEDDTVLRVEKGGVDPNGKIDVRADVFNVNLAQIATWVPALRGENGAPLLKGSVSDFSVSLGGTTQNPEVVGSLLAENLAFGAYSLDRVLVSRFEIKEGQATIEPGNLSLVRGGYTSRSASGRLPVDFTRGGLQKDAPLSVHLPLETRDFTAVAGLFVPGLRDLSAQEIQGDLNVIGTFNAPQLAGELRLRQVGFGLGRGEASGPLLLSGLSGTVRFVEGNHLVIDANDPLRGKVQNRAAGAFTRGKKKAVPAPDAPVFDFNANFRLAGGVRFDLAPRTFSRPLQTLGRHVYDLRFALSEAAFSSSLISGVRDGEAAILMKSQGEGAPLVKWMLWARGARAAKKSAGGGGVQSVGSLRLPPDFGVGLNAIARASAENFGDGGEFSEFPVAKKIQVASLADRRPQVLFQKLEWAYTGVGRGELDGRLVLDNRSQSQQSAPFDVSEFQSAALRPIFSRLQGARTNPFDNSPNEKKSWLRFQIGDERRTRRPVEEQLFGVAPENPEIQGAPTKSAEILRLGGQITLQNSEIVGAPTGENGTPARLSTFPFAPRFDLKVVIGERVLFLNSVFRTGISGELVVSGTPRNPQVVGTVRLEEGQIRFPNARARIGEGTLQIAVTRDPETDLLRSRVEVDAEAIGQSGIYQINLKLRGPLDLGENTGESRLQVDVETSPALSQDIAFAQLLGISPGETSRSGNFDSGRANQAYAQAVLQFVAAPFFSGFERSVASALGLDNVAFEYRFNEALAIQLSKNLGDRVIVSYRRLVGSGNQAAANSARIEMSSPEELRIDYRIKGDYLLGAYRREFKDRSTFGVTVQRSWRF